jgi:hypothetical protein
LEWTECNIDFTRGSLQLNGQRATPSWDDFDIGGDMKIPNVSIALFNSIFDTLPDGSVYPIEVG